MVGLGEMMVAWRRRGSGDRGVEVVAEFGMKMRPSSRVVGLRYESRALTIIVNRAVLPDRSLLRLFAVAAVCCICRFDETTVHFLESVSFDMSPSRRIISPWTLQWDISWQG